MKSILLPITSYTANENIMRIAGAFAFQYRASLKALFVRPDARSAIPFMGEGLTADMIQDLCNASEREGLEQAGGAKTTFLASMEAAGVPVVETHQKTENASASWQVVAGEVADYVGRRARTSDVAICTRPDTRVPDSQEVFKDLVYRSGRPLIVIPTSFTDTPGRRVLVGWNGSAECARAVGAALPILWSAEQVSLLQIGDANADRPGLEDVAEYLADHGVSSERIIEAKTGDPVGAQMHAAAVKQRADMIVLGAYSHSRWRELILGGVTQYLATHSELPIFMSH